MHTTVFERNVPQPAVVARSLEGAVHRPFWIDDLGPDVTRYPQLEGDASAALVIVGGGYTGLWTALRAKEREPERSVILLEGERIAWAASGRNGGFCEASLTHGYENGKSRWPQEIETLERLGLENLERMQEAIERYGMDCEWERTGELNVAVEPHQLEWLAEESGGHVLNREATRAEVNSPTFLGSVWLKDSVAMVHPYKLATELARVVTELGVTIHEGTRVRELVDVDGGVDVVTDRGTVRAGQVVLGTNVFPSLLKRNALMTVPVYDYALMTEPLSQEQLEAIGWTNRQGIGDMANQFHYYRITQDNRILFGGYDALYFWGRRVDEGHEYQPETWERLASHFFTTFPQLEGVKFTHKWAGPIDSSTQFCAFFGTARKDRVAYAAGFTGLGVGATAFAADVLLDLLSGADTERTRVEMVRKRPLPFPPEPFASVGINLTRWSMDRADHNEGKRNFILKALDAVGLGFDS
ncbi:NAD(P)/FAD-dependent oxidoreductase [Arthrobacter woluwensis]|uniref:Glycine/D-amino acid oxidase n=1 Tax=Arthrobacter woluwensis TaxID=156980 RepID=A0A1H4JK16_9MICC|nr:FAD-dependent oxidoreductase [Arthrobacter woluwensis]SEB46583.1 Glycine/D-amino acid oxidase [Arthrobacter woluwensis]